MPDGGVNPARSGAMTHTNTEWSLGGLSGLDCMPDQRCLQIPQILPVAPILDRDRTTAVGKVRLALRNFGIVLDLPRRHRTSTSV
jgi:hypothetical protein